MCPRINLSSFSRCELGTPLLKLLNCKCNSTPAPQHPSTPAPQHPSTPALQHPGVVRLHVNAFYFSTTAGRVTSPTWGPPPPCKQALKKTLAGKVCLKPGAIPQIFSWIRTWPRKRRPPTERNTYEPMASISAASRLNASEGIVV